MMTSLHLSFKVVSGISRSSLKDTITSVVVPSVRERERGMMGSEM